MSPIVSIGGVPHDGSAPVVGQPDQGWLGMMKFPGRGVDEVGPTLCGGLFGPGPFSLGIDRRCREA
jgi:hypothetical protein